MYFLRPLQLALPQQVGAGDILAAIKEGTEERNADEDGARAAQAAARAVDMRIAPASTAATRYRVTH